MTRLYRILKLNTVYLSCVDITNPDLTNGSERQEWYNDHVLPMAKESVIAIVLGLVLGVAVALAAVVYTVNIQKKQNTQIQKETASSSSSLVSVTIPPTVTVLRSLEISSPQSGSTSQEKTIVIKGIAGARTLIVVQSPIKTQSLNTDKEAFSIDFPLALGENVITVSAYHEAAVIPVQKKLYIYRLNP